ncbi:hypothetical protein LTR17_026287 [Elasticomyces elasticus]|nr:hypothetical protein LTR17_026287 [Elasticomyces elasticus]
MTLRVVFDRDIGLVLGAQVTGLEVVDKRIDVLATCIQAAMTMHDLEHLELSYALQYSSVKGPINMAGFGGGNLVDGNVRFLHFCLCLSILQPSSGLPVYEAQRNHIRSAYSSPVIFATLVSIIAAAPTPGASGLQGRPAGKYSHVK